MQGKNQRLIQIKVLLLYLMRRNLSNHLGGTKMNIKKMKQIIDLIEELEHEDGIYGFNLHGKEFQVSAERLANEPELQVEERGTAQYPYEIFVSHHGFRVFALIREDQLKEFPQLKSYRKQLYLKKLSELEDEEAMA